MRKSFIFKRIGGNAVYTFHLMSKNNDIGVWKREDKELWCKLILNFGWSIVDEFENRLGWPEKSEVTEYPPEGIWISKKDNKSYRYELIFLDIRGK